MAGVQQIVFPLRSISTPRLPDDFSLRCKLAIDALDEFHWGERRRGLIFLPGGFLFDYTRNGALFEFPPC